jgi:CheY-like chemotaxis protein
MMMTKGLLHGRRVLVVEDEALVAMMVEDILIDAGCVVVDTVGTLKKALMTAQDQTIDLDCAVLDVNLGGEKVFPVADALESRGIPFIFATGYGVAGIEQRFEGVTVLGKPYQRESLESALARALQ